VGEADVADVPAGPGSANGLHHRLLGAYGLDDRVGAEPIVELLDCRDARVVALGHDVRGAVLAGQLLPRLMSAHGDDALGAELLRSEHTQEADGTIADDGDALAGPHLRHHRADQLLFDVLRYGGEERPIRSRMSTTM
jgi:hypothetical protein